MIVRENQTWLTLVFSLRRGNIVEEIWKRLLALTAFSVCVTWLFWSQKLEHGLTTTPFTLVGFAVSIFLGFRNNAAYDRFWEGRKLWGALVNTTRTIVRQALSLPTDDETRTDEARAFARLVMGYAHALRVHLRGDDDWSETVAPFVDDDTFATMMKHDNKPLVILATMSARLRAWRARGALDGFSHVELERRVADLTDIQGACERIRSTPLPVSFTALSHRMIATYLWMLPLGLIDSVGLATPIVTLLVGFSFFGLDQLGEEMENPFGIDCNDLPLIHLATMIERNLCQAIGEESLPPLPRPNEAGVLL